MSRLVRPGLPARGSKSGLPIMALLDLLGRRWALRLVWELRDGGQSFRALQERCGREVLDAGEFERLRKEALRRLRVCLDLRISEKMR